MPEIFPLAVRLRPETLDDFIGQKHLLGEGKLLRRMIEADKVRSLIVFGPPGTGKTTLARIIAKRTGSEFYTLNATNSGTKDIRALVDKANTRINLKGKKTIVFADEIHRWSKNVQDVLLPSVENGTIILIGATTQNPYFSINGPLISRSELFEFEQLKKEDLKQILARAVKYYEDEHKKKFKFQKKGVIELLERVGGDARKLYNVLEIIVETDDEDEIFVTKDLVTEILPQKHVIFDRAGEEHFDALSAIQGSIQASDPHSAVYWLAWAINRGEDVEVICRRLLVTAAEDVGLCDPQCLPYVLAAVQAAHQVGFPEAAIILSSATAYMAMSPRSKASAKAIWTALSLEKTASKEIPKWLKDCHYGGAKKLGRGQFKDGMDQAVYEPIIDGLFVPENGIEIDLMKGNDTYWKKVNNRKRSDKIIDE